MKVLVGATTRAVSSELKDLVGGSIGKKLVSALNQRKQDLTFVRNNFCSVKDRGIASLTKPSASEPFCSLRARSLARTSFTIDVFLFRRVAALSTRAGVAGVSTAPRHLGILLSLHTARYPGLGTPLAAVVGDYPGDRMLPPFSSRWIFQYCLFADQALAKC